MYEIRKLSKRAGLLPGDIEPAENQIKEIARISLLDYNESEARERVLNSAAECCEARKPGMVRWISIEGTRDHEVLKIIGERFNLHPLVLEDILSAGQRPKMEDFEDYLFFILKILSVEDGQIVVRQASLVLGADFVVSFHEGGESVFEPVREQILKNKGRIRKLGADYLVYALIDAVVDGYLVVLESEVENLEELEEKVIQNPTAAVLMRIRNLKRNLIRLRKSVWPLREVVSAIRRGQAGLFTDSTMMYMRDVLDHTIEVVETIDTFNDILSEIVDIYLSSTSNKMNAVMKVLTIIATIFIPLTFIAGVYGMNFKYMPEIQWRWGYPAIWAIMITIAVYMLVMFRKKEWM